MFRCGIGRVDCAIGVACTGMRAETTEGIGAGAHGIAHFEVVGVAVDELLKGVAGAVVLFGFGMCSAEAQHGVGQAFAGGEMDDELLKFPCGVAVHAVVKNADGQFKMRFFILGAEAGQCQKKEQANADS